MDQTALHCSKPYPGFRPHLRRLLLRPRHQLWNKDGVLGKTPEIHREIAPWLRTESGVKTLHDSSVNGANGATLNLKSGEPIAASYLQRALNLILPLVLLLCFSVIGTVSAPWLGQGNASLIFVLGISLIGATSGLYIAVGCAVVSAIIFDYFVSIPVFFSALPIFQTSPHPSYSASVPWFRACFPAGCAMNPAGCSKIILG